MNPSPSETEALNRRFLGLYHGAFLSRWKLVEEVAGWNLRIRGSCSGHGLSGALISLMTAFLICNLKQ